MLSPWHSVQTARLQIYSSRPQPAVSYEYTFRAFVLSGNQVARERADRECNRTQELCPLEAHPTSSLPGTVPTTAILRCGIYLAQPEIRNPGLGRCRVRRLEMRNLSVIRLSVS